MKQIRQTWVLRSWDPVPLDPLDHDDFNEEIRLCEPNQDFAHVDEDKVSY